MKCCVCKQEINVASCPVPPTWFGTYRNDTMLAVICCSCLSNLENKKKWESGELCSAADKVVADKAM